MNKFTYLAVHYRNYDAALIFINNNKTKIFSSIILIDLIKREKLNIIEKIINHPKLVIDKPETIIKYALQSLDSDKVINILFDNKNFIDKILKVDSKTFNMIKKYLAKKLDVTIEDIELIRKYM